MLTNVIFCASCDPLLFPDNVQVTFIRKVISKHESECFITFPNTEKEKNFDELRGVRKCDETPSSRVFDIFSVETNAGENREIKWLKSMLITITSLQKTSQSGLISFVLTL